MLEGVHVETASQAVTRVLLDAILDGRIPPGKTLRLQEISDQLGLSMMPVREAIRQLAALDLVEIEPRRGARVRAMSVEDLQDTYFSRVYLESIAVWEAAKKFTQADYDKARAALIEQKAAQLDGDLVRGRAAHERFHFAIYEASQKNWLLRSILPAWRNSERYRVGALAQKETLARRGIEHQELLDSVSNGDGRAAVGHLATHLATSVQLAWASMGSTGDLVPIGGSREDIAALIDQIEASQPLLVLKK